MFWFFSIEKIFFKKKSKIINISKKKIRAKKNRAKFSNFHFFLFFDFFFEKFEKFSKKLKNSQKSSDFFLKKVFSKIKKYCLSRFLFMIWNISLLLKNHTYISRFDFIRVRRIQTSNRPHPQDSISITMFIYGCSKHHFWGLGT